MNKKTILIFIIMLLSIDAFVLFVYHHYHMRNASEITYEQQLNNEFEFGSKVPNYWGAEPFCKQHPDHCGIDGEYPL